MAQTPRHPAQQHTRLADMIIDDCTPKPDDPETVVSKQRFAQQQSPALAGSNLQTERRRSAVAKVAQVDELDLLAVENPLFRYWFELAESHQQNYQTSPGYPLALHYLKRVFIAREQLPSAMHMPNIDGIDTHEFSVVLRTLIEEL